MAEKVTGGCLCGAVRFETDAEPIAALLCHCTDCQHVSGAAHYAAYITPLASLEILAGDPAGYTVKSDQGRDNTRRFCQTCGSRVWAEIDRGAGIASVNGMALDDRSHFQPTANHRLVTAPAWCQIDPALGELPVS